MTEPRPPMDRDARRAARARVNQLSRLPFLYEFAQKGKAQSLLASSVQVALAILLAIGGCYLLTGEPLPRYVAFAALAVALALQALSRFLNARAGRR